MMLTAVLSGFGLALTAPWLYTLARGATGWLTALLPLGLLVYFGRFVPRVAAGEAVSVVYPWAPSLGINLSFYVDGLSLLFAFLVNGIGALILIYAGGYLKGHHQLGRFFCFLLLFMASMLGLVLAGNILTLFVFWELTSISSYLLIGFNHEDEDSRAAALQALLVTGGGGLALLAGLVLLGQIGGSFEIPALLTQGDAVRTDALYFPTLLLVLLGAFTKSAQVPFHFWLPGAMAAPTPVSAYLHSATMVKAGIYLLARLHPVLGGTDAWLAIVTTVGAATMLTGGIIALYQTDLKRLLAFSTISALGTLTMLLGLGSTYAIEAMIVFLLAHALYKGALFMIAGAVDHETGTRDVEQLDGLRRAMPITALVAALAAVSLAGFGPLLSFIGKELLLEAVLEVGGSGFVLVPATVLAGTLFVTVAAIVGVKPFWGPAAHTPKHAHEAPVSMWLGPALLAALGIVFGLLPNLVAYPVVTPAVGAVLGVAAEAEPVSLYLWHGINTALILSIVSVIVGLALYAGWTRFRRATGGLQGIFDYGPARWYKAGLDGLNVAARAQTRLLQSGYLRFYFLTIMVTTIALVSYAYLSRGDFPGLPPWNDVRLHELGLAVLILLGAIATVRAPSRLSGVAALGVVGFGVALMYIIFGAPDLAMTQFMIETLTVILFVFVFYHLPRFNKLSNKAGRIRDAIIACAFGAMMTVLVLAATTITPDSNLSRFYAENSRELAHGRNIVNVILVDFRALDTLGEITVLGVAAIGVFALLKFRPHKERA
jgi:multicomponent Na+:H+ antiporter subunit A